ncbi:hypothetical protein ASE91_01265 [Sphingomonas sp. Leaf62]|nr:hypothetical protein ASE91_01265 [Sphingomonas sp. Leaf62]
MRHGIWATLDLDPTTDRSAIRKAYAAKLKAMDVDADPAGFAALRAARDAALAGAAEAVMEEARALATETLSPDMAEAEPPPGAGIDPELAAFHEAINVHFQALESLLFPGHDAPPTAEELTAIEHHGHALLADARLEQVDFVTGAERWLAEVLSASIPRSDTLLEPAAAAFGWIDRRNDYALSPEAVEIVERIGTKRFVHLVSHPDHRFHRAWTGLVGQDRGRFEWFNQNTRTSELLQIVRERHPAAEQWLDPARVARWEQRRSKRQWAGTVTWLIIFLLVVAVRILNAWNSSEEPQSPKWTAPASAGFIAEPNQIARDLTGEGIVPVSNRNPKLAAEIRATVAALSSVSSEPKARQIINELAGRRILSGLANAPDALLRDVTQFEIDGKRALLKDQPLLTATPERCNEFQFPAHYTVLFPDQRPRQEKLIHRAIMASDQRPVTTSQLFMIPGSIVDEVRRVSGLPEDRLREALTGKGEAREVCRTAIALREVALTAGKSGMVLLRAMQPTVSQAKPNLSN